MMFVAKEGALHALAVLASKEDGITRSARLSYPSLPLCLPPFASTHAHQSDLALLFTHS
jgi:hypothetical protein